MEGFGIIFNPKVSDISKKGYLLMFFFFLHFHTSGEIALGIPGVARR